MSRSGRDLRRNWRPVAAGLSCASASVIIVDTTANPALVRREVRSHELLDLANVPSGLRQLTTAPTGGAKIKVANRESTAIASWKPVGTEAFGILTYDLAQRCQLRPQGALAAVLSGYAYAT